MYLHRLELAAIGPFAGRVDIDFAALGASGVFLLEGPTGAGKSTVIDAVVFALYGSLAGEGASKDRLHSHHAAPGDEPFVDLVFETAAGVHRIRRTPAYERPKQRGAGTVQQQASAQLWRLAEPGDPVGEPVSARAQEIGAEVQRIIGLDRAQFVQTVVLPQGEFDRFLRSPGEDRRALLQSLFGTAIYEQTTDELVQRRRAAAAAVDKADGDVRDALNRLAEAAGRDAVDETEVDTLVAEVTTAAQDADAARAAAVRADAGHRRASDACPAATGGPAHAAGDARDAAGNRRRRPGATRRRRTGRARDRAAHRSGHRPHSGGARSGRRGGGLP
jgi:exonuclease SbcC